MPARPTGTPVTLCGELAGKPISAMALIGIGYRSISMSAAAIGPVKAMLTELPYHALKTFLDDALVEPARGRDMRRDLQCLRRGARRAALIADDHDQPAPRTDGPARQALRHARSADGGRAGPEAYVKLASEYSELQEMAAKIRDAARRRKEIADLEAMLADRATDAEMRALAEAEMPELEERIEALQREIQILLLPQGRGRRARTPSSKSAPAPAATRRRCSPATCSACTSATPPRSGWKVEVASASEGEVGGYKEIIATVSGKGVFAQLKFESGVHRVQRVPATEAGGRIHTSAATVAVLPEAEEVDIEIRTEDIRIDTMRASGAGGQHVNTTDSAVRITHLPTGIVVVQAEKSQHQNRARAMQILRARLYDWSAPRLPTSARNRARLQVGSGDRSERIRTYNFPQGRVTDHRINLTLYKLDRVMLGELDEIINALIADHQSRLLADAGAEG